MIEETRRKRPIAATFAGAFFGLLLGLGLGLYLQVAAVISGRSYVGLIFPIAGLILGMLAGAAGGRRQRREVVVTEDVPAAPTV